MNNYKLPVIIPARAGSKGIKDKNILKICDEPLISWSIKQALSSKNVSNVYVSTDGDKIAEVAKRYGAKIIWRPEELALDTSSSEDALIHAVHEIEKNEDFETLVFLQATSPIRRDYDIDNAIDSFYQGGYDSLFSMAVLDDYCLWKKEKGELNSFSYDYKKRGRRQEREPLYLENGSIYIFKKNLLLSLKNRLGGRVGMYEMPFDCSYEIDNMDDVERCEYFMKSIGSQKLH